MQRFKVFFPYFFDNLDWSPDLPFSAVEKGHSVNSSKMTKLQWIFLAQHNVLYLIPLKPLIFRNVCHENGAHSPTPWPLRTCWKFSIKTLKLETSQIASSTKFVTAETISVFLRYILKASYQMYSDCLHYVLDPEQKPMGGAGAERKPPRITICHFVGNLTWFKQ